MQGTTRSSIRQLNFAGFILDVSSTLTKAEWKDNWSVCRNLTNLPSAPYDRALLPDAQNGPFLSDRVEWKTQMDGPPAAHPLLEFHARLEAESELKLCDPSGKGAQGAPEISRISEIRVAPPAGLKRRKIENIEDVEEVGPDFQVCGFAEMQETWQPRLLDQTEIHDR